MNKNKNTVAMGFNLYQKHHIAIFNNQPSWINYHVTKHVINSHTTEQIDVLIDIDSNAIQKIRDHQRSKFNCNIHSETQDFLICTSCKHIDTCNDFTKHVSNKYIQLIKKTIKNDNNNPRSVTYYDSKRKKKYLIFISDDGLNVISHILRRNKIIIKTSYRSSLAHLDDFKLKILKAMGDSRWHLSEGVKKCKRRLSNPEYSNVSYYKKENWV